MRPAMIAATLVSPLFSPWVSAADRVFVDGVEDCSMMVDADGDRLYECDETMVAKTDPLQPDTDADGLSDGDELLGTLDGLNLPALGVKPLRKDILVEYDWVEDANGCALHTHALTPEQYESIRQIFANAPVENPDGSTGINLIQDYGQGGAFTGGELVSLPNGVLGGFMDSPEREQLKSEHFAEIRRDYFHYATLVHAFGTPPVANSGISDLHDDFTVSMHCMSRTTATRYTHRNTIVHELGHDLGLSHGGGDSCNAKPNYNSVMNYRYQFEGYDTNCVGNPSFMGDRWSPSAGGYSHGLRPSLDEKALDEHAGVCGLAAADSIDWNGNGLLEPSVMRDLNLAAGSPGSQQLACGGTGAHAVLHDHDDRAAIDLTRIVPDALGGGGGPVEQSIECAAVSEDTP